METAERQHAKKMEQIMASIDKKLERIAKSLEKMEPVTIEGIALSCQKKEEENE